MGRNPGRLSGKQIEVLRWVSDGLPGRDPATGYERRITTRALERRGLITINSQTAMGDLEHPPRSSPARRRSGNEAEWGSQSHRPRHNDPTPITRSDPILTLWSNVSTAGHVRPGRRTHSQVRGASTRGQASEVLGVPTVSGHRSDPARAHDRYCTFTDRAAEYRCLLDSRAKGVNRDGELDDHIPFLACAFLLSTVAAGPASSLASASSAGISAGDISIAGSQSRSLQLPGLDPWPASP